VFYLIKHLNTWNSRWSRWTVGGSISFGSVSPLGHH